MVKAANESGGYGMLIGSQATKAECDDFREKVEKNPRNYIAQPIFRSRVLRRSAMARCEGRHIDLRPYILYGEKVTIVPGGLTRVALQCRVVGGEFFARRRQQRHLGASMNDDERTLACLAASPIPFTG